MQKDLSTYSEPGASVAIKVNVDFLHNKIQTEDDLPGSLVLDQYPAVKERLI